MNILKKINEKNTCRGSLYYMLILCVGIVILVSAIFLKGCDANSNNQLLNSPENMAVGDCCYQYEPEKIKENLKKFKDFGRINISDSPVVSLKQITVADTGEVFYSNCDGSIIFVGALIDNNGNNLTKIAMDKASQVAFQEKNINKEIAIKLGNGNHEILEFTDPDCSYCRAAETMFHQKKDDIDATRYIFFTPLDTIHPEAEQKAIHILCSNNPAEEYIKVISNQITSFPNQCEKGKEILIKHREVGASLGVNGTPTFYVDGVRYIGANPEIFNKVSKSNKE